MDTSETVSTKMEQIATNARRLPEVSFTSLAHHVSLEWLYEAYKSTNKNKAPGVDGITAEEYAENLKENLERLLEEYKSGRYKAPPVKRVYIPKENGEKRPLGITTFEDKILQLANKWILEPLYEEDFYDSSYGFRPNRSQHMAIKSLWDGLMGMGGAWIIDMDISKCFDSIKWNQLREILKMRVRDGVIVRTIGKWMNAGIMEENNRVHNPEGEVQQGGVISPLLCNIFLHKVLDEWFHETVIPRLKGKAFLTRFADDTVLCFQNREDAERVREVLPKRLAKYGLKLNEEKTKLIQFKKPGKGGKSKQGDRPDTFDFLGFTHYWGKSRKGRPVVKRKTRSKKLTKAIRKVYEWVKKNRHSKIEEQYKMIKVKIRGHYNYYGINGNFRCLCKFLMEVKLAWHKWLNRRSRRRDLNWEKYNNKILSNHVLPSPYIKHRFA